MPRRLKLISVVLLFFLGNAFLHLWLNIGFDKVGRLFGSEKAKNSYSVGYLPVT